VAEGSNKQQTYTAALGHLTGVTFHPYDSNSFEAADQKEAIDRATQWSKTRPRVVDPETWLMVSIDGRSVYIGKLG
jgi:hypothetical protein